jgi:hypothetical protein
MEKEKLIDSIIELEWPMFRDVNGDTRADCQENYPMFVNMRTSQFSAWNEEALSAYREDLRSAEGEGRNLLRDKYIHMMASTDPAGYLHFLPELPPVSEEKKALVEEIWQIMLPQTIELRRKYPNVGKLGRPLLSADERNGYASVETYEKGELMTYGEKTLRALLAWLRSQAEAGVSIAAKIQENGILSVGYASMEEAEEDAKRQLGLR